ncbi:unnamed protein product [Rhodiola kirilowii]
MAAALYCSLEVDVNGEETFLVDKELLCAYSSKLSKLFGRLKPASSPAKKLKVIFNDFPGGARSFELLTRFCYNNGNIIFTPFNICLLHSAARYMEMDKTVTGAENLVQQAEKSLRESSYWSWNEVLAALKQCQDTLKLETSSSLLQKCVESIVGRLASASEASSCLSFSSSSDSFGVRFSCDTKSTESLKNTPFRISWWFEDLAFLSPELLQIVIKLMVSQKLDNLIISKFIFFYQKTRFAAAGTDKKRKLTITAIDMLYLLDWRVISFKSLLGLLRSALSAKVEKPWRTKLETVLGSQMDQATLDSLLIPSPNGANYLYDVNLVLRLLKAFVLGGCHHLSLDRLRNVGTLIDVYISEVAPDPSLKPSKFLALTTALPDRARESYDGIYRGIDLYIQVHGGLSKEEKLKICSALNYDKLSPEACAHLAQNSKFPSRPIVEVLISQQLKLKSVLKNINMGNYPKNFTADVIENITANSIKKAPVHGGATTDNNVASDDQTLKEELHGMQWRVLKLEKVCKKMQIQMTKVTKSRQGSQTGMRSLPKLCS